MKPEPKTLEAERMAYALKTRHLCEPESRQPKFPFAEKPSIGRVARVLPYLREVEP